MALVLDDGRSIAEAARNIGVLEKTLGKWVKKERDLRDEQRDPDESLTRSERAELEQLRADYQRLLDENAHLQMQASFAKKVATWFAKDQQ
ncbi:transposase [Brooklawnia propionicigenes]|uniref:transposase n=1 Tax=Brooklawnia propionicigenes TaxID=3041175 RepID=UPI0025729C0D|nr:transposase [Brooklawnia sp. SH051]